MSKENNNNKPEEKESNSHEVKKDFIVTPWDTSGKIDYNKLVEQFGTELIDDALLEKFKKVTGKELHPWMKRGIFFTHRSFGQWLDAYANGDPVFLYTGRGPSTDAMHIGHLIPFMFTKWLQEVFDCPLVVQISDEEKAAFKGYKYEDLYKMGMENAKEIISCGFNPKKTFLFCNREYRLKCPQYENFAHEIKNNVSIKLVQSIFGLKETGNIGMYDWPIWQSAAAFYQSYPHIFSNRPAYCLIPHAIDQDPYFRLSRDIAAKMNLIKQSNIECLFLPPLNGNEGKMSSSTADTTLFLDDTEEALTKKIVSLCASGADSDPEVHKKKGGNVDKDIAYQYLKFFEMDDDKLEQIKNDFSSGKMSALEIKEYLAKKIWIVMKEIQENRKKITDDVIKDFFSLKPMELPKPKMKEKIKEESELYDLFDKLNIKYDIKYHQVISTKDQSEELARTLTGTICKGILLKSKEGFLFFIINEQTNVNTKTLMKKIKTKSLRFAENDTYELILKLNPKICPTPFVLKNDKDKQIIKVLIDENIPKDKDVCGYSLRPDCTCTIKYDDLINFVKSFNYEIINVKP